MVRAVNADLLKASFRAEQDELAAAAAKFVALSHGSTIGSGREDVVRDRLGQRLVPSRVTHGQIASLSSEAPSSEWDAIVTDPTAGRPLLAADSQPLVAIESVLAVVSVKSTLVSEHVAECASAAAALRGMLAQETPGSPVPAVFVLAFDGLKGKTLRYALDEAAGEHGELGRIDATLIVGQRVAFPSNEGHHVDERAQDAYLRWFTAVSNAIDDAPPRRYRLSSYLDLEVDPEPGVRVSARTAAGATSDGVKQTKEVETAEAIRPLEPPADGGQLSVDGRPVMMDLAASRTLRRIRDELASDSPGDAESFDDALQSGVSGLETLAGEAAGSLLHAVGRALMLVGRDIEAAEALERCAAEPGASDVDEMLATAAASRIAAGDPTGTEQLEQLAARSTHPAVRLEQVKRIQAPTARLDALASITPTSPRLEAYEAALRFAALSEIDRDDEVVGPARAQLAARWHPALAERLGIALLRTAEAQRDVVGSNDVDGRYLEAAEVLAGATDELLRLGDLDPALGIDARLMFALVRLERWADIDALGHWWLEHLSVAGREPQSRISAASAMLDARRPDLAERFAPDEPLADDEARLLQARLDLSSGDPSRTSSAVATLDELLATGDRSTAERHLIATSRLIAAAERGAVWSEPASAVVAERSVFMRDVLHAEHLSRNGEHREAETVLLPYAGEERGIRALIDVAFEAEDFERVVRLVDDALGDDAPAVERLRRAEALRRLGRHDDSRTAWRQVAELTETPPDIKERAWRLLTRSLTDAQQWDELAEAGQKWHRQRPDSPLALWVAADALARTGYPKRGYELVDADGRQPTEPSQQHLLASLAVESLPLPDALAVVAQLSDNTGRTDEVLESMLIIVSAGKDKDGLPAELEARVRLTFADFADRFPDSERVQSIKVPESDEEWEAFAERHLTRRHSFAQQVEADVAAGRSALAMVAVLGESVLTAWMQSNLLPVRAPSAKVVAAERADADAAIAAGAAWDVSTLAVLARLDEHVAQIAARALTGSVAPRALTTEVQDARRRIDEHDPARSPGSSGWDPVHGQPQFTANTEEEASEFRVRLERIENLASGLKVIDPDVSGDTESARALRDPDIGAQAATWLGAARLAEQRQLAYYCDDRYLRSWARNEGLATFGTLDLLEALAARGTLDADALTGARWALREAGARHMAVTAEELVDRVTQDGFRPTRATDGALRDPDGWHTAQRDTVTVWLRALGEVQRRAPDELYGWVGHMIDRLTGVIAASRARVAAILMLAALGDEDGDAALVRDLLSCLRRVGREQGSVGDPVGEALGQIAKRARADGSAIGRIAYVRALSRLPLAEQLRRLGR